MNIKNIKHSPCCKIRVNDNLLYDGTVNSFYDFDIEVDDLVTVEIEHYNKKPTDTIVDENKLVTKRKKFEKLENKLSNNIDKIDNDIDWFTNNDVCPSCQQNIGSDHKHCIVEEKDVKKNEIQEAVKQLSAELDGVNEDISKIEETKTSILNLRNVMNINTNKFEFIQKSIEEIETEMEDAESNNKSVSKLEKELKTARKEMSRLDDERKELTDTKNYYVVASQFLKGVFLFLITH